MSERPPTRQSPAAGAGESPTAGAGRTGVSGFETFVAPVVVDRRIDAVEQGQRPAALALAVPKLDPLRESPPARHGKDNACGQGGTNATLPRLNRNCLAFGA